VSLAMSIKEHKAALEAAGFTVAGDVAVLDRAGIVVAEDHPHGFWSKSAEVDAILAKPVSKPKPVVVEPEEEAEE
jgi:hypothetical protein